MGSGQVSHAVDGDAADDGEDARGRVDHPHVLGNVTRVAAAGKQEAGLGRAGRPAADVGEVIGPGIDKLQDVVAVGCVGHVQHQRPVPHVAHGDQIQRVVVGRDELGSRVEQVTRVAKRVVGQGLRPDEVGAGRKFGDLAQVIDERVAVQVCFGRQFYPLVYIVFRQR